MALRSYARPVVFAAITAAALAPIAPAAADVALPDGMRCDVLDCRNDTDREYVVSGSMQCEYSDPDGGGSSGSEQFTDVVPAHTLFRLQSCIDGQSPYLRSIDEIE
ncbi:hypothetical protein [Nocardia sp. NPDC004722]